MVGRTGTWLAPRMTIASLGIRAIVECWLALVGWRYESASNLWAVLKQGLGRSWKVSCSASAWQVQSLVGAPECRVAASRETVRTCPAVATGILQRGQIDEVPRICLRRVPRQAVAPGAPMPVGDVAVEVANLQQWFRPVENIRPPSRATPDDG